MNKPDSEICMLYNPGDLYLLPVIICCYLIQSRTMNMQLQLLPARNQLHGKGFV